MREKKLRSENETTAVGRSSLCFPFLLLVLILSLSKLQGFLLYGFPKENSLCLWSLVFIDVHVILSVKDPKIVMLAYMMKNNMVSELT